MLDLSNDNSQLLSLIEKVDALEKKIIDKEEDYAVLLEQNKQLLNDKTNFFDDLTLEIRSSPLWPFFVFIYSIKKKHLSHDSKISIIINSFLDFFKIKKKGHFYGNRKDRIKIYQIRKIRNHSKKLFIPRFDKPLVSIIIPAFNGWAMNYRCINSIILNTIDVSYEIILADDCSTDGTMYCFEKIENIKHIRNEKNLGFLQNCNNASQYAAGEFVLFLNNDTEVTKNWLNPLVTVFEKHHDVGLVGSKLIFPDGRLQEAGGIIWNDASGENYGKNENINCPEFNYLKEVDYVSGACMLLRKKMWDAIGGFDELFSPAYYEDTDLAFSIRKAGLKVMYQPLSVVFHYEGFSHGKSIHKKNSIKANQELNKIKFYNKWHETLLKYHFNNNKQLFYARDKSGLKKTILVIDHYVPEPDKDAGSKTMFLYLNLLIKLGYNVKFIAEDFKCREPYTTTLEQNGIEVLYGTFYHKNYKNWIIKNANNIDFILLSRPKTSIKFIDLLVNETNAKIVYLGHDLHFLRKKRNYEINNNIKDLESAKRYQILENYLFNKSDSILTFSSVEKDIIQSSSKDFNVTTIPLLFFNNKVNKIDDFEKRNHIMFVGGFNHLPNIDGVKWFVDEVFPLIRVHLKNVKFKIAGANPPKEILDLQSDHVEVLGHLSDNQLEKLYADSKLSVIPLRYGAGVKGKLIEAMSKGIPIVSTSIGIEGITDYANQVSPPQDDPSLFAKEIIRIYENHLELSLISDREVNYINTHYNIEYAKEVIKKIFS